jgi:hypothetical protein
MVVSENLRSEERKVLKQLFEHAQKFNFAYALQDQLTAIFDQPIPKKVA